MKTVSVTVFLTVTYAVTELKILMLSRLTRETVSVTVFLTVTYAVTELKILMFSRLTRENSFSDRIFNCYLCSGRIKNINAFSIDS